MPDDIYNPVPRLIDFATKLRFEDLRGNVVHETVRRVVDSLATALGGLSDPRLVQRWRYMSLAPCSLRSWRLGLRRAAEAVLVRRCFPQLNNDPLARLQRHLSCEGASSPQRQHRRTACDVGYDGGLWT
jgi:hypothetical protein